MPLILHYEVKIGLKNASMTTKYLITTLFLKILIYFDDLCKFLYISITEMSVCNCLGNFELFYVTREENH